MLPNIADAACYLVVTHATAPEGNWVHSISDELARALYGRLLAAPYFSHDTPYCLVGQMDSGRSRIPRIFDLFATCYSGGRPEGRITNEQLKEIVPIAEAIPITRGYDRIARMLRTFKRASEEKDSEVRLHQLVRTCEGFIAQHGSGIFCDRLPEVAIGREMGELRILYNVRSSIEHLSGAFAALEGPGNYKHWRVDWHLIRAESIARHILRTIFLEPALWRHFATEQTLE